MPMDTLTQFTSNYWQDVVWETGASIVRKVSNDYEMYSAERLAQLELQTSKQQ